MEEAFIQSQQFPGGDSFQGALIGENLGGVNAFFDWWNPAAAKLLKTGLEHLYKLTLFDGLWLARNEPSSYCDGECPPNPSTQTTPHNEYLELPYNVDGKPFEHKTLSSDGRHYGYDSNP